jgi:hypothetical protein
MVTSLPKRCRSRRLRLPFRDICSPTSFGSSLNCGHRRSRQQRNEIDLSRFHEKPWETRVLMTEDSASPDARPRASLPRNISASHGAKPCYGRSLNRDKDVIWRMSDESLQIGFYSRITTNGSGSRHREREDLLLGRQQSAEVVDQKACGRGRLSARRPAKREKRAKEETSH